MSPRVLIGLVAAMLAFASPSAAQPGTRPNILLILADDLGWGDLRSYNPDSRIPTPHLDRLASQGMRFTDVHTPSSVCTPTRYGLLTGRYCWRTAQLKKWTLQGYDPLLIESGRLTLPGLLKQHGYDTAAVGKWHLGLGDAAVTDFSKPLRPGPNSVGFDYFFGISASLDMPPYVFIENDRVTAPPTNRVAASEMRRKGGAGFWREGDIAPGFTHEGTLPSLTEKAVALLRRQPAAKPFFLYVPLTGPHTPWMPTAEFRGKSGAGWYGDFVVQVDGAVGRLLRSLEDSGLATNTLVIFTSDNGAHWLPSDIAAHGHRSNASWRGQKADWWEGGHRVPFLARWPGRVAPGSTNDALVCLTDLFATTAELLGAKLPADAGEDSFSFLSNLLGRTGGTRTSIVHHSGEGGFAIREGPWKLCMGLGSEGFSAPKSVKPAADGPKGQLYHLGRDPQETSNRWLQEPAVVARLTSLLNQTQQAGQSRTLPTRESAP